MTPAMRSAAISISVAIAAAGPVATIAAPTTPAPVAPAEASAALRPAIARGETAARALQERLTARLRRALAAGGPAAAIEVCRTDAPRLAAEVSAEAGVRLGRTSDRLRSSRNGPPAWARSMVEAAAGRRAAAVGPAAVDLGDRVGLLLPIPTLPACLACHGPPARLDPAVRRALDASYPADRATGYAAGDHRGYVWAEIPR